MTNPRLSCEIHYGHDLDLQGKARLAVMRCTHVCFDMRGTRMTLPGSAVSLTEMDQQTVS